MSEVEVKVTVKADGDKVYQSKLYRIVEDAQDAIALTTGVKVMVDEASAALSTQAGLE